MINCGDIWNVILLTLRISSNIFVRNHKQLLLWQDSIPWHGNMMTLTPVEFKYSTIHFIHTFLKHSNSEEFSLLSVPKVYLRVPTPSSQMPPNEGASGLSIAVPLTTGNWHINRSAANEIRWFEAYILGTTETQTQVEQKES